MHNYRSRPRNLSDVQEAGDIELGSARPDYVKEVQEEAKDSVSDDSSFEELCGMLNLDSAQKFVEAKTKPNLGFMGINKVRIENHNPYHEDPVKMRQREEDKKKEKEADLEIEKAIKMIDHILANPLVPK